MSSECITSNVVATTGNKTTRLTQDNYQYLCLFLRNIADFEMVLRSTYTTKCHQFINLYLTKPSLFVIHAN